MTSGVTTVAIFSLTEAGSTIGEKLVQLLPDARHYHRPKPFSERVQHCFTNGQRCIFICSTAIVMRTLGPVLRDKYHDPAVIVIDEQGKFVIPLLSGHEGGAGAFAYELAQLLSAQCVVTSATDYSRPVYTVGMGCDRGCPLELLQELFEQACAALKQPVKFTALASIDLKADEKGLLQLAGQQQLPFQTFTASQLRSVEQQLSVKSDIVYKEVGCYGVAEAAALCAASAITAMPAELVLNKQKNARATISVARSYEI